MSTQPRTRSACDRCHSQKLRCPKQAGSVTCARCSKAGARCVYSPPGTNFTPTDDINVTGVDVTMSGNLLGAGQTSMFTQDFGWTSSGGIDFANFEMDGQGQGQSHGNTHEQTDGYPANYFSTLAGCSDPRSTKATSPGDDHDDPKSACTRKLTSLLQDAEGVWSRLPVRTAIHTPRTNSDEMFLSGLSDKLSTRSLLESFFGLTQRLIDVYPAAVSATMAAESDIQTACELTDCTHHLELVRGLQEIEDQILGQGVFSGPDIALANLLISCHTRLLDILDRLFLLVTACTRVTLANRREPDFEVSELRVGAFIPHRTAAMLMQFALLKHLVATLTDRLASFRETVSSWLGGREKENPGARMLSLQVELLRNTHATKATQVGVVEDFLLKFDFLKG